MMSKVASDQPPRATDRPGKAPDSGERLYNMRIDRDGVWHHEGRPIARMPLVKLFASVLKRDSAGDFWLETPVERGRIEVEDAPFVVIELEAAGSGQEQTVRMRTNLDEWVTIGPDHPLRLRLPRSGLATSPLPYVDVRPTLEGRLLRSVYYELVALGDSHRLDGVLLYGVWSAGQFFPLES